MRRFVACLVALAVVGVAGAQRAPLASFVVSGSSGNWTLDFTLTSNFLAGEGGFYFFGVRLDSGRNIVGSPVGWNPDQWPTWDNAAYGGSSTVYNNNWIAPTNDLGPGESLSGFQAISTDAVAPTSVQFFAYAAGGTYGGSDHFHTSTNPGFEGFTGQSPVPEPFTLGLMGLGLGAALRRRNRR